jgi:hypothetical protein
VQRPARGEKDAGGGEASFRSLKYTVGLLHFHTKKKGTDCNAIQRPTSSDMDNTHRAETVQPWLTKQKSHEIFRLQLPR